MDGKEVHAFYCAADDPGGDHGFANWCEFRFDGGYSSLVADLAIDDRANRVSESEWSFIGDGKLIKIAKNVKPRSGKMHVSVPIKGIRFLEIRHKAYPLYGEQQYMLEPKLLR